MKWNKLAVVFLLAWIGSACDPGPPRIVNSASAIGSDQTNRNSPVNVYNGYPGPGRPKDSNSNANAKTGYLSKEAATLKASSKNMIRPFIRGGKKIPAKVR